MNETVNINVLTSLTVDRIKYLIGQGSSFADAQSQAEQEILAVFKMPTDSINSFVEMDITQQGTSNEVLLAVSCILLNNNTVGELSEAISKINLDIKEDGTLDDTTYIDMIYYNATSLNIGRIKYNLENKFSEIGISDSISSFDTHIANSFPMISILNYYNIEANSFTPLYSMLNDFVYVFNKIDANNANYYKYDITNRSNPTLVYNRTLNDPFLQFFEIPTSYSDFNVNYFATNQEYLFVRVNNSNLLVSLEIAIAEDPEQNPIDGMRFGVSLQENEDFAITDTHIFIYDEQKIEIFDITDIDNIVSVGDVDISAASQPSYGMTIYDDNLYIKLDNKLLVFDISNPTSPTNTQEVSITGNLAFILGDKIAIRTEDSIIMYNNPSNPEYYVTGSVLNPNYIDAWCSYWQVVDDSTFITLGRQDTDSFLAIMELSEP